MAEENDTYSEAEGDVVDAFPMSAKGSTGKGSTERYNSKGMRINHNNVMIVISLRHLALANQIPAKTRDEGTAKFFDATLKLA